jgi:hypothetical protein
MRKFVVALLAVGCLSLLAGTLSTSIPGQVDLQAQKCDPKDPKCGGGTPCSPGYWKNHPEHFYQVCGDATSCATLWEAITCKGSDASCGRSAAAAVLNANAGGCFE